LKFKVIDLANLSQQTQFGTTFEFLISYRSPVKGQASAGAQMLGAEMKNLLLICILLFAAAIAQAGETAGGGASYSELPQGYTALNIKRGLCQTNVKGKSTDLKQLREIADQTLGGDAPCYLKLFMRETGGQATCYQPAGHARNPYAAYGLCSMWASPARLKTAGGPCTKNMNGGTPEGIANQMLCCRHVMESNPAYHKTNDPNKKVQCA